MRGVFKRFGRPGMVLVLLTLLVSQAAVAKGPREEPWLRQRFERAKRFIVTVLSRFSIPPGEPVAGTTLQGPSDSAVTLQD